MSTCGVAKGGGELGARAPGSRPYGRINTLYSAFKNLNQISVFKHRF